jgi:hypothetical protein
MSYKRVPFRRWHLAWLEERGDAAEATDYKMSPEAIRELEKSPAWTGIYEGEPIACGGVLELWPGRFQAWAFLNKGSARHMGWITRQAHQVLAEAKGRIELSVRCDFAAGHRWARLLGFEVETPVMKAYGPDGADHTGYVKVN